VRSVTELYNVQSFVSDTRINANSILEVEEEEEKEEEKP
jgi:hypothetical protein